MSARGEEGSLVSLLCDEGERYVGTYYDDDWLASSGLDWRPAETRIATLLG